MTGTAKKLPDSKHGAGDDGCGPVTVVVKHGGGLGGDPCYAGGYIEGHTGHAASMMSQAQMRRLAAALIAAADAIEESGLPSFKDRRKS